jgi:hypothetical protein
MANLSSNSSFLEKNNTTYFPLSFWLDAFGSTYFIDSMYLFVTSPLSFLGLVSNLIAFRILCGDQFKTVRLYSYQKVYLVNSATFCLVSMFSFLLTRRFIYFYTYAANIYIAHVYLSILNFSYFYAGCLDILIIIDRIILLRNKAFFVNNFSPYLLCFVMLIAAIVIEMPYFFKFYAASLTVSLSANQAWTVQYVDSSEFSKSTLGLAFSYMQYALRDFLVFAIALVLNVYSIYILKIHLAKKSNLLKQTKSNMELTRTKKESNNQESVHKSKNIQTNDEKSLNTNGGSNIQPFSTLNGIQSVASTSTNKANLTRKKKKITNADVKTTLMVIFTSTFGLIVHSFECYGLWYFTYYIDTLGFTLASICNMLHVLKHSLNLAIYLTFNTMIYEGFKMIFKTN